MFQINTLHAKKVVDIYSNAGSLIFTYVMNCQPQALVSAKIINILRSTLLATFKNTI